MTASISAKIPDGLDTADSERLGGFLRQTLDQHNIVTKAAIAAVPRSSFLLYRESYPMAADEDIAGMVKLQIGRKLPFPSDEAVLDFEVSDSNGPRLELTICAARRDLVEHYKQICCTAGLKLRTLGTRPDATMIGICASTRPQPDSHVLVLDVGHCTCEISILHQDRLTFSRSCSVPVSEVDCTDCDSLVAEIVRSVESYGHRTAACVETVFVHGYSESDTFSAALSEAFNVPVHAYNAPSPHGRLLPPAVIGMGLSEAAGTGSQLNFAHPKQPTSATQVRNRNMTYAAVAAFTLLLIGGAVYGLAIHPVRCELAHVTQQIDELTARRDSTDHAARVIRSLEWWQHEQPVWPDQLMHLMQACAQYDSTITFSDLRLNADKGEFKGDIKADDRETLVSFLKSLQGIRLHGPSQTPTRAFVVEWPQMKQATRGSNVYWSATLRLRIPQKEQSA